MQRSLTASAAVAVLALSGCASTGPVVIDIRSDRVVQLTIEKCNIHLNAFMGDIDKSECNETYVQVGGQMAPLPAKEGLPGFKVSESSSTLDGRRCDRVLNCI